VCVLQRLITRFFLRRFNFQHQRIILVVVLMSHRVLLLTGSFFPHLRAVNRALTTNESFAILTMEIDDSGKPFYVVEVAK
jgi:hypothetical protein